MEKAMDLNAFVAQDPNAPITRGQAYGMVAGIVGAFDGVIEEVNVAVMENRVLMDELVGIIKDAGLLTEEELKERLDKKKAELKEQLTKQQHVSKEDVEAYAKKVNGGNDNAKESN